MLLIKNIFYALRAPILLFLLYLAVLPFAQTISTTFFVVFIRYVHEINLETMQYSHADQFLHLRNFAIYVSCILAATLLILMTQLFMGKASREQRLKVSTALVLVLSFLPLFLTKQQTLFPGLLLVTFTSCLIVFLWLFLNHYLCEYKIELNRGKLSRFILGTGFVVTDLIFFGAHFSRVSKLGRRYQIIYLGSILLVFLLVLIFLVRPVFQLDNAEKINLSYKGKTFMHSYSSELKNDELIFTNAEFRDPFEGIYRLNLKTGQLDQIVRTFDPHNFIIESGNLYYYDRERHELVKYHLADGSEYWRAPLEAAASYFIYANSSNIFAVGEQGKLRIIEKNSGEIKASFSRNRPAYYSEAFDNGTYYTSDCTPYLEIFDENLRQVDTVALPITWQYPWLSPYYWYDNISWIVVKKQSNSMYIVGAWGELYRYDLDIKEFTVTQNVAPLSRSLGVDEENNLFFLANYLMGFIDVYELSSGKKLGRMLAAGFGRSITLDTDRKIGILHTLGRGMWKFNYGKYVQHEPEAEKTGV